jgi:DNA polymerase-1
VREYLERVVDLAEQEGYVETLMGRRRYMPELKSPNPGLKAYARRAAANTPLQGSAADLIKVAMVKIHHRIKTEQLPIRMILQVHDELVFEVPLAEAQKHAKWIADEMTNAIRFDVPLKVDTACGPSWLAKK